jgi:hypothetical protein
MTEYYILGQDLRVREDLPTLGPIPENLDPLPFYAETITFYNPLNN